MYPNGDFCSENKPSGNPGRQFVCFCRLQNLLHISPMDLLFFGKQQKSKKKPLELINKNPAANFYLNQSDFPQNFRNKFHYNSTENDFSWEKVCAKKA
jgi:hypothetical protein